MRVGHAVPSRGFIRRLVRRSAPVDPWLSCLCPGCGVVGEIDLRTIDRHPDASVESLQRPELPSGGCGRFVLYCSHERRRAGRGAMAAPTGGGAHPVSYNDQGRDSRDRTSTASLRRLARTARGAGRGVGRSPTASPRIGTIELSSSNDGFDHRAHRPATPRRSTPR